MHPIDKKIKELKIFLPEMASPVANYVPYKVSNNMLFISGQGPIKDGKVKYEGKIGKNLSAQDGIEAAKLCCINIITIIKYVCNNDWNKFQEILKIGGFVNCVDTFKDHPIIINGASNLLVDVFGEKGRHSRFAVGTNSLPMNFAVEIEAVVLLSD